MSAVEYIAGTTLTTATTTVDFTGIPATYADLIISAVFGISANADATRMQFNSDTASNYSNTNLSGNGSSAQSNRESTQTSIRCFGAFAGPTAGSIQTGIIQIQQYANTSVFKTNLTLYGGAANEAQTTVGLWRSTAAITAVRLFNVASSTFTVGSSFTLWGVR